MVTKGKAGKVPEVIQAPLFGPDVVEEAIEIIRQYAPQPVRPYVIRFPSGKEFVWDQEHNQPYLVAFSGGKDSVVLYDLVKRAGVDFEILLWRYWDRSARTSPIYPRLLF